MDLQISKDAADLSEKGSNKILIGCYIMLILLGAIFFIPFLGNVHLFDWDEINFAEAAREMIASKNYMRVTINYEPFWEKPPLFFWMQVLSMKVFGINEFAARIVNALFGIFTLVTVFTIGRKIYDMRFGLLWAGAFIGSFLPHLFFKSGIIDPVFNLFIFSGYSLIAAALLTKKNSARIALFLIAGVVTGLAVLAKGPVAFLVIALSMSVYWASVRFKIFFKASDILFYMVAMIITASSFYGIETIYHGTWFIKEFIKYQIELFSTGVAGQERPFYFHFFVILFGCFPASFFAIRSFYKRFETSNSQYIFNRMMIILFWVVLILFSIVKTKTVLYASLTWFPVTYLAALHMYGIITKKLHWNKPLGIALIGFSSLIALIITVFPIILEHKQQIIPLIHDRFAIACLQKPVQMSGFEWLVGFVFFMMLFIIFVAIQKNKFTIAFISLFFSCALCLQLFMLILAPKIEDYTQGDPIAFYKQHAKENVYMRSLFKSYSDLFYGEKKASDNMLSRNQEWLMNGPIDKPVYFVCKSTQAHKYTNSSSQLILIKKEYGFVYFRRDPVSAGSQIDNDLNSGQIQKSQ